jgi:hypothetical protein
MNECRISVHYSNILERGTSAKGAVSAFLRRVSSCASNPIPPSLTLRVMILVMVDIRHGAGLEIVGSVHTLNVQTVSN